MHHAHLRFTPQGTSYDISGLLLTVPRYVIAKEVGTETEKAHYHVYMETDRCEKSLRNDIIKYLQIPKMARGQANTYYCLKVDCYKDPSPAYVCKDGVIIDYKGYTEGEIQNYEVKGAVKFNKQCAPDTVQSRLVFVDAKIAPTKQQSEWDKLLCAVYDRSDFKSMTIPDIKRYIKHFYLRQTKPIPRDGDLARYSYSIYAIIQEKTDYADISHVDEVYLQAFPK